MPAIPRLGYQIIGLLAVTTLVSLGLQTIARSQTGQPPPAPPDRVGKWKAAPGYAPNSDMARDYPPAAYRLYTQGDNPPIYVSVARATTLNAFRAPFRYVLDADAHVVQSQETSFARRTPASASTRRTQEMPYYDYQIAEGTSGLVVLLHWTQVPGQDPTLDPLDTPSIIAGALFAHSPVYQCDAWIPLRGDISPDAALTVLRDFAETIDKQIKTGHAP